MGCTIFRDALLWDGIGEEPREGMHVLVEGERIREVSDRPIRANGARAVALEGRTLMPGLIDAHFHAVAVDVDVARIDAMPRSLLYQHARRLLEDALQRGFTSVRDAGGADRGLAQAVDADLIAGPRLFVSGKALSQTGGHGDFRPLADTGGACACGQGTLTLSRIADGVDAVRQAARDELRKGAAQIKIMASGGIASPSDPIWVLQYSEEEIRAIVWEARSWRTYVMAHAYTAEAIRRTVACGVRSVEHANLIDAETAAFCAGEGAFVVPTLATYAALHRWGRESGVPEHTLCKLADVRESGLVALEHLQVAGARIGFGTDLLGVLHAHQLSEFAIRSEVQKPRSILASATRVNAELLGREGELGCVAAGALADLIVVDGNPLDSLRLLSGAGEHVAMVMKGGRIHKNTLGINA